MIKYASTLKNGFGKNSKLKKINLVINYIVTLECSAI